MSVSRHEISADLSIINSDQIVTSISDLKRFKNWSIIDSRNTYIKSRLSQKISSLIRQTGSRMKGDNSIPVFTVSSMEHRNFIRNAASEDADPDVSSNYPQQEYTEIEKLREHCISIGQKRRIRGAQHLFELKFASVINALKLCLHLIEARSAFPEKFREEVSTAISSEFETLTKKLQENRQLTLENIETRIANLKSLMGRSLEPTYENADKFNRTLLDTSQPQRRRELTVGSLVMMPFAGLHTVCSAC